MPIFNWPRRGAGSSTATAPTAPTLAIADNGDGTGGVATISGGDSGSTHTVYYQRVDGELGTSNWTSAGSRSGNGTVAVAPTADRYYWWYAKATSSGGAAVSNLVYQNITSGTESVHYRCLLAAQSRIQGLTLSGIANGSILVQKVPMALDALWGASPKTYQFPGIILSPLGSEKFSHEEGSNYRDTVGYPVVVAIFDADNRSLTANHAKYLLWRQKIERAFRNQRLPGVTEIERAFIEPGPILDLGHWFANRFHSALTIRFKSYEVRGI